MKEVLDGVPMTPIAFIESPEDPDKNETRYFRHVFHTPWIRSKIRPPGKVPITTSMEPDDRSILTAKHHRW